MCELGNFSLLLQDVGSYACAFLNSMNGGCLYIGVEEDGEQCWCVSKHLMCHMCRTSSSRHGVMPLIFCFISENDARYGLIALHNEV